MNDEIDAALDDLPVENVDEPDETAAPEEETVEPEPAAPAEDGEEDAPVIDAAYVATLEKRIADQESFIGRQKNEVGEARQTLEQMQAQLDALTERQQRPTGPPSLHPEWLDEEAFTDPQVAEQTVLWAATEQPGYYQRALRTWHEVDSAAATDFQLRMQQAQFEQTLDERMKPLTPIPDQLAQQASQAAVTEAFNTVWSSMEEQHPDITEYADKIGEGIAAVPELARVFESGDEDAMRQTLSILYDAARARREQATSIAAEQEQQAATSAKTRAKVVTATQTAGTRAVPKADPFLDFLDGSFQEHGKFAPST